MKADRITTLDELKRKVQQFCEERDWDQFHNPKDLAIGVSTEANELLDIFRFKTEQQMREILLNPNKREHVEEELADTLFFVLEDTSQILAYLSMILQSKVVKV
ncbi:MAG: nucleotide pyrophosphohydrolase [Lachnospiraceae bacterium]|nr:nucleotide pyrophosphohydrolase [Lachnospiraceae bacterium]